MNPACHSLEDFIRVQDEALPASFCDSLVTRFLQHERLAVDVLDPVRDFRSLMLNNHPAFQDVMTPLLSSFMSGVAMYCKERRIPEEQLPFTRCAYEALRIKRYVKEEGRFDTHVDVADHASARRALACFWYLNDVEEGGETLFFDQAGAIMLAVKPVKGRMVIFPPNWMFPHAGTVPRSSDKFFLGTYLHYT